MESIYTMLALLMAILSGVPAADSDNSTPAPAEIIVDKPDAMLYVVARRDTLARYSCALGCNLGDKRREGDRRTPEGVYEIVSIEDSSDWGGDASGSDYGPWFFRLGKGKWDHIGIHGTNRPESVGKRASLGCIRLHNSDLKKLKKQVGIGTKVTILPDTAFTDVKYPVHADKKSYKKGKRYHTKGYYKSKRHRYRSGKSYVYRKGKNYRKHRRHRR